MKRTFSVIFFLSVLLLSKCYCADIDVIFSPQAGALDKIVESLDNAQASINLAVYKLYNEAFSDALLRAHNRGVDVRVILDGSKHAKKDSKYDLLKQKGMNVIVFTPPSGGHMHHKFCVVDEELIITGSYNWNYSAEEDNNETLLFIKNDKELIKKFIHEFNKIWNMKSGSEEESNVRN
ncbi:MAG: phospholipase D-like domain-containing protein [Vulcanimicrobiota bacterium]